MKISCLLTCYNRPSFVRQALKSVQDQTHSDYELIVLDESTIYDIRPVVAEFKFPDHQVHHFEVADVQRKTQNRLSININFGLARVKGDLIVYLCDDDFLYPNWFADISAYFGAHPDRQVAFGKLSYTNSLEMEYPEGGYIRYFNEIVPVPGGLLDHNQVAHRRFAKPYLWPEEVCYLNAPDGTFFNVVAKDHQFYPIEVFAAVKRGHSKCLQRNLGELMSGGDLGLREPQK
jgi:glycosyltransferase involved in cell wall biosynthesis